jgi:hypothetical protein
LKQPVQTFKPRRGIDARQRIGPNRSRTDLAFIDQVRSTLGFKVAHRDVVEPDGSYALRATEEYALKFAAETEALGSQNTFFGKKSFNEATT